MVNKSKGFSLIYVLILIFISVSFGMIVLNKQNFFEKNLEYDNILNTLSKNIVSQVDIYKNILNNNINKSYLKEIKSCPNEVKYFSGNTLLGTGKTNFVENNNFFYCSGILNGNTLNLFYLSGSFSSGTLNSTGFNLINNLDIFSGSLLPNNSISFSGDIIDTRYIDHRILKNGIIFRNTGYQNIFWINDKLREIINKNKNNTGSFVNIGNVNSGALFFDTNDSFSGKIIEFNKNIFGLDNKLVKKGEINFSSSGQTIGYLQDNLSFSSNFGTPKYFDFKNNDYAVFLSYNTGSLDQIKYTLKIFSNSNSGVIINGVDDDSNLIEYLGNGVIINNGQYYNKIYKLTDYK
ncbi:hypothetical protein H3C61_03475 [Candidatus Gracilibacteria bacterium]|nr:hypothetical protein [Candidatus Gracilibacteria bacterium]